MDTVRSGVGLRLIAADELDGNSRPDACVEVFFGPMRPADDPDAIHIPPPFRITPTELVHLWAEAECALGEVRAEVMRAEIAWKKALGEWYMEGRHAVESREPGSALLAGVLEALRKHS
ncbi:hypothetical protein [Streptomyces antimycoticus]|uniref:hypothetical protein n=1 Tax=Streptomyces antimycoticus TaxID=68175 RepID=UPI0036B83C30